LMQKAGPSTSTVDARQNYLILLTQQLRLSPQDSQPDARCA